MRADLVSGELASVLREFYVAREPLLHRAPVAAAYVAACLEEPGPQVVLAEDGSGVLGAGIIRCLEVDSEVFGRSMARVEAVGTTRNVEILRAELLSRVTAVAREGGIRHLLFRCPALVADWIRTAQLLGFSYVSTNLYLSRRLEPTGPATPALLPVEAARPDDEGPLLVITEESFSAGTRFHLDARLGEPGATELHRRWLVNSLTGAEADCVLVRRDQGRPVGFITGRLDRPLSRALGTGVGRIELFAVARRARGRGVGRALVGAFLAWLLDQGGAMACVDTEAFNAPAVNTYVAAGFRVTHAMHNLSWGDA